MGQIALVFGATGLVGHKLLRQLEEDDKISEVRIFVREQVKAAAKTQVIITDFKDLESISSSMKGDVAFCCIGTTIKKAGSQEVFRQVDHDLVIMLATIAKANNFPKFLYISSIGANATSRNFYLRVKGEVEKDLNRINFELLTILRPSFLLGDRKEFRLGELIGKKLMYVLKYFFFGKFLKYKPIDTNVVAKAMKKVAFQNTSTFAIYESHQLQELGE